MAVLQQTRIPILLSDSDLTPGSWRDLLAETATLPDPPLVIVSSRIVDEEKWAEALNLGAYDVLAKPFNAEEVIRVLSSAWLHWKADRRSRTA
jgi:DNA-binding NtrC family response regulator